MLLNPFTPSELASNPGDFFGRYEELNLIERSINQGSICIDGGIGIGKSSLLARIRLVMEGFDSIQKSTSVIAVGSKGIESEDDAAKLVLESFIEIDESEKGIRFKIGSDRVGISLTAGSKEVYRFFKEGRHLSALKRILEKESLEILLSRKDFLLLAIDETDKCPIPIARLIRSVATHVQQEGVRNVRFILAGISPFFKTMINEDPGINRFFYRNITLKPLPENEATELVETKFRKITKNAKKQGLTLQIDPAIIRRLVAFSGGHPHLLQLLGSYLVEHEEHDPDGVIDSKDLVNAFQTICYEDRAYIYNSIIHTLRLHNKYDTLKELFNIAGRSFPTRINRERATFFADKESIEWLVEKNILFPASRDDYGLVDEFLRVRTLMDDEKEELEGIEDRFMVTAPIEKFGIDDGTFKRLDEFGFHEEKVEEEEED